MLPGPSRRDANLVAGHACPATAEPVGKRSGDMRRAVTLCDAAFLVMAFLGGALVFSLASPSSSRAQSSQGQEVRASAFVLVGSNGADVARLEPGVDGNARPLLN